MSTRAASLDVVICTHDPERWDQMCDAVASAAHQERLERLIVVVDGATDLFQRAVEAFADHVVVTTGGGAGLSTARNLGVEHCRADYVAFLDDDATADDQWLVALATPLDEDPNCAAVGGLALARWPEERPSWFAPSFDWTVGCTHPGYPMDTAVVRNVIGCNMAFRRDALLSAGGFDPRLGRRGHDAAGGEETELCLRLAAEGHHVVYTPHARVAHQVSADRTRRRYLLRRCYKEGRSKAVMEQLVGTEGLGDERDFVRSHLVPGITRDLASILVLGIRRAERGLVSATGLLAAGVGLMRGRMMRRPDQSALKAAWKAPDVAGTTVVIATHGRPDGLERTLRSLGECDPGPVAVVVVENGRADAEVEQVVSQFPHVQFLREPVAGLAHAHNVALDVVETEFVAFTDDDVMVDRAWIGALESGFDEHVGCVTGLVNSLSLANEAERLSEAAIGHGKGFEPRLFDPAAPAPLFPFTAGELGTGANMAFRTRVLHDLGGFDPVLGAGTPARGADDLAAFADVVDAGWHLRYEPAAIVHHQHHDTMAALRRQIFGYGVGYGAYVTRLVRRDPRLILHALRHLLTGIRRAGDMGAAREIEVPRHLGALNLLGMTVGPVALARSRREMARRLAA